ncbi:uncharacterized protein LTR77_005354 [Saxophila tyrrhenica]|uniref:alpha-glucosidase n=1 Tax=Saxophila tyrrhenica TaxID=1690608 RepID=A0AAV9P891_9PEZI|nr:hypothetical protein LTR77_005354 [Saxophila tyrrhenica]
MRLSSVRPIFLLSSLLPLCASQLSECPGYTASNVQRGVGKITADLNLAGEACNVYGHDLRDLRLLVEYQTAQRLHVKIYDAAERVYQIPEDVVPRPPSNFVDSGTDMTFNMTADPFSFTVTRTSTGEVLFDTSGSALIFESEYLRLRTGLPEDPNLYGLGESADKFRLPTKNYSHTLWNAGEPFLPKSENLYGSHNVIYDHRGANGTSATFLMNSNGAKVNIVNDPEIGQYVEYNSLGGVLDFYFMNGDTPKEATTQYAELIGYPALMPWWGFGYHQCRYGMVDVWEVAGVVANYSAADIPLEVMWTDIDYMDYRRSLSLDPLRFPLDTMQQMVDTLHARQQKYIMMVDPAMAKYPYEPFRHGENLDAFMQTDNGTYTGVVWAGPSVFPDWFAPNTQQYWNEEFNRFFNAESGVNVDGIWIDMNEPSNFCDETCVPNPALFSIHNNDPPRPPPARMYSPYPIPGFPENFQPGCVAFTTFNVEADVNSTTDQFLLLGDAFSIGQGEPHDAPQMWPYDTDPPNWNLTVQLPPNSMINYQYALYHYGTDGSYTLEHQNRTVNTGGCNTMYAPYEVHDTMSSSNRSVSARAINIPAHHSSELNKRQQSELGQPGAMMGLPGRELLYPEYNISNYWPWGNLSVQTVPTDIVHANGLVEFDVHNLYGTMMSTATRNALLDRQPGKRPLIITRSTFAGAGKHVGHWFGDNISTWDDYRTSIRQMVEFAALFQMPMVGSDVCGFNGNTTVHLCSRWAMLGAFNPFYRNHDVQGALVQEFYRWPLVAAAARSAINTRYRLLDYLYTAMYRQHTTGTPTLNPLFFIYPEDANTFDIGTQFFYGESILVSPVLEENATSVEVYLPDDVFYDLHTHETVRGHGEMVMLSNISYTEIPTHVRGGSIVPMRMNSANTTAELRKQNFTLLVAPGLDGTAAGSLYVDDGESLEQDGVLDVRFEYSKDGVFSMGGTFGYETGVWIETVVLLGGDEEGVGERYGEASAVHGGVGRGNAKSLASATAKSRAAHGVVKLRLFNFPKSIPSTVSLLTTSASLASGVLLGTPGTAATSSSSANFSIISPATFTGSLPLMEACLLASEGLEASDLDVRR